jgi:hypothetical protein
VLNLVNQHAATDVGRGVTRMAHRAHRRAERDAPCELVIRDAYHHVVSHEFVAARKPESPQTTE